MNKILIEGDRLVAFLMANGKMYSSDCDHQECLEKYYKDNGITSEFDYSDPDKYDKVHEAETKKTAALKNAHDVYGFDLFDTCNYGYVLLAHDKETFNKNLSWMKQYRDENSECGIELAYFTQGMDAVIIDDCAA